MSRKAKQWYYLTETQLERLVAHGTYSDAKYALNRVQSIKKAGHTPAIYYSEFNGFMVIDEDDFDQFQRGLSIQRRAKAFAI